MIHTLHHLVTSDADATVLQAMAKPPFCGPASPVHYQPEEGTNSWRRRGLPNLPCPKSPRSTKEHGSISRGRRVGSIRCELPPKHIRCSLQGQKSPNLLPHQHELVDHLNRMCSSDVAHPSIARQCITYQRPRRLAEKTVVIVLYTMFQAFTEKTQGVGWQT